MAKTYNMPFINNYGAQGLFPPSGWPKSKPFGGTLHDDKGRLWKYTHRKIGNARELTFTDAGIGVGQHKYTIVSLPTFPSRGRPCAKFWHTGGDFHTTENPVRFLKFVPDQLPSLNEAQYESGPYFYLRGQVSLPMYVQTDSHGDSCSTYPMSPSAYKFTELRPPQAKGPVLTIFADLNSDLLSNVVSWDSDTLKISWMQSKLFTAGLQGQGYDIEALEVPAGNLILTIPEIPAQIAKQLNGKSVCYLRSSDPIYITALIAKDLVDDKIHNHNFGLIPTWRTPADWDESAKGFYMPSDNADLKYRVVDRSLRLMNYVSSNEAVYLQSFSVSDGEIIPNTIPTATFLLDIRNVSRGQWNIAVPRNWRTNFPLNPGWGQYARLQLVTKDDTSDLKNGNAFTPVDPPQRYTLQVRTHSRSDELLQNTAFANQSWYLHEYTPQKDASDTLAYMGRKMPQGFSPFAETAAWPKGGACLEFNLMQQQNASSQQSAVQDTPLLPWNRHTHGGDAKFRSILMDKNPDETYKVRVGDVLHFKVRRDLFLRRNGIDFLAFKPNDKAHPSGYEAWINKKNMVEVLTSNYGKQPAMTRADFLKTVFYNLHGKETVKGSLLNYPQSTITRGNKSMKFHTFMAGNGFFASAGGDGDSDDEQYCESCHECLPCNVKPGIRVPEGCKYTCKIEGLVDDEWIELDTHYAISDSECSCDLSVENYEAVSLCDNGGVTFWYDLIDNDTGESTTIHGEASQETSKIRVNCENLGHDWDTTTEE